MNILIQSSEYTKSKIHENSHEAIYYEEKLCICVEICKCIYKSIDNSER